MATDTKTKVQETARYICGFCATDNCGSCRGEYRNARPGGQSAICVHEHTKKESALSEDASENEPGHGVLVTNGYAYIHGDSARFQALNLALEHHRRKGQSEKPEDVVATAKIFEDYLSGAGQ
jgi:NADH:ubiquinone oxidoreductase subunit F (NADH-binding)